MTLGQLIKRLEKEDPNHILPNGFLGPHSYRGYYEQLAFEPAKDVRIGDILREARNAVGAHFQGWKGGCYTMNEDTEVWLSVMGAATGDLLGPMLLEYILNEAHDDRS